MEPNRRGAAMIRVDGIPAELRSLPQWVTWKTVARNGKPTKVPYQCNGVEARSDDPATWAPFEDAYDAHCRDETDGVGFVFARDGGFVGVDLDGCRNPETGVVMPWAREVILRIGTYAEVSPSQSGVKLYCRGRSPFDTGKNLKLPQHGEPFGRACGIEIYDRGRYFAVTGMRLRGLPAECVAGDLNWLRDAYWPMPALTTTDFYGDDAVVERARRYLAKCPPAVSGSGGHNTAFHAACVLVLGFGLSRAAALTLLREWNQTCQPPWSERELEHKIDDAGKQAGQRNYLRNVSPQNWATVAVPSYTLPRAEVPPPNKTTLVDAAKSYIERLKSGGGACVSTGISELDYALGGGIEGGEMVIIAARPSHGKSMLALQLVHHWTAQQMPVLMVSEEMSPMMLGKRSLQFISDVPQHRWADSSQQLEQDLDGYARERAICVIAENCRTSDRVVEEIATAVKEHSIQAAIVDYAQLLRSKGKDRYECVTNTSIALRQAANEHKILVVVLCQLNREIEKRQNFTPLMSDLKESGQLEQDADVIMFLVWPWKLDKSQHPGMFRVYVAKNKNRAINNNVVDCEFDPMRQFLKAIRPENYCVELEQVTTEVDYEQQGSFDEF